jgi:hypothetical protein
MKDPTPSIYVCTSYYLAYSVNGLMYMRTYSLDTVTLSELGLREHNANLTAHEVETLPIN